MTNPEDPFAAPGPGQQPPAGPPPGGFTGPPPGQPGYGPPPGQPGYGPPPAYGGPPGYGPPAQPQWSGEPGWSPRGPETSTKAIIALVLSVASFAVCPLVPAIVALVLASSARQEIQAAGGRLTGLGLVTGAKVVSWINIGLCVLVVIGFALLFGVSASSGYE